jgi:hypothetical protein
MIPEFPQFKRLEVGDQLEVEAMTSSFPPYSDFNFVSLWCWSTDASCMIARLHGNLVVRMIDYLTNAPLLTFLGVNSIEESAETLLDYAVREGIEPRLRLVPSVMFESNPRLPEKFQIEDDPGSADYVLSVPEWADLEGSRYREKRKAVRKFERTFSPVFTRLDLRNIAVQREIMRVFGFWIVQRLRAGFEETVNESVAVQRFFALQRFNALSGFGVEIDGSMQAFLLIEELPNNYLIGHFWKANIGYPGIYSFLMREMCRVMRPRGYRLFNIEQDLGKPGLAQSKQSLRPCCRLQKVEVSKRVVGAVHDLPASHRYCFELAEKGARS